MSGIPGPVEVGRGGGKVSDEEEAPDAALALRELALALIAEAEEAAETAEADAAEAELD